MTCSRQYLNEPETNMGYWMAVGNQLGRIVSITSHASVRKNGAPLKPDVARRKFSRLCGTVARERVPITLEDWRKLSKNSRDSIKAEILKYFNVRTPSDLKSLERASLLIACKAWKQRKSRLVLEFMHQNKCPLKCSRGLAKTLGMNLCG